MLLLSLFCVYFQQNAQLEKCTIPILKHALNVQKDPTKTAKEGPIALHVLMVLQRWRMEQQLLATAKVCSTHCGLFSYTRGKYCHLDFRNYLMS